ncbi:MAG: glycine zipper 2TM domain-containing protein [Campylobacterota bacterium]|nr:glycine zipper 2TM domain-containing protein [Campylobacterota bacterium]
MRVKNIKLLVAGLLFASINSLSAKSMDNYEYVDVIKSKPIYKTINVRVPYEEVVSQPYSVKVPCGNSYVQEDKNSLGIDTIIGAGLGIAVGNQIGGGHGREAARVIGGLLGANIANNTRQGSYQTQYCTETRYKDVVVRKYDYKTEKKIQGYKNIFYYNGKKYKKRSKYPLKTIRITKSISY